MENVLGAVVFFPGPNAASLNLRVLWIYGFLRVLLQSPLSMGCMALVNSKPLLLCGTAGRLQKGFEQKRKGSTGASKHS